MNTNDTIRERVSEDYARAVTTPKSGGGCCEAVAPKGVAAKIGGYESTELGSLPANAVENSFGCGNPMAFSGVKAGDVVLDLGCGAGIDLLLAARKVGPTGRVIGIDMTDAMIERARANIAEAGLDHVEVRKGFIEDLPVESASVDWVISNCVINLSPEKQKVFAEIARVLKPGGQISISDLVASDLPDVVRNDARLHSSCIAGAISEPDYIEGLRKAGLSEVAVAHRIVYDCGQVRGLLRSELPEAGGCCGTGNGPDEADLSADIEGRIWSAQFAGRR